MENESKIRLLSLCKLLYERSDEAHPLSTTQIIEILKNEYSISAHRTTISKDVDVLKEFGVNVGKIESTQNKYFIERRLFETSELKLLIDAVESSKFITLAVSCARHQYDVLSYRVFCRQADIGHPGILRGITCQTATTGLTL